MARAGFELPTLQSLGETGAAGLPAVMLRVVLVLLEVLVNLVFLIFNRFAYIEFADKESVRTAMALDESLFRGRQIKVRTLFSLSLFTSASFAFGEPPKNVPPLRIVPV